MLLNRVTYKWVADRLPSRKCGIAIAEMAGAGTPTALLGYRSMTENASTADKSIVGQLDFTRNAIRRVTWEAFEFSLVGPHQVRVTSASYGYLKDDHSYVVGVEERDGVPIPAECECPGDVHHDTDCAHKVALASLGGSVVLNASMNFPTASAGNKQSNVSTLSEKLRADGGATTEEIGGEPQTLDATKQMECDCENLHGELSCWPCASGRND